LTASSPAGRGRARRLIPRLTLQGQLSALAALGVALAVLGAMAVSYFLVAGQLNREVDSQLVVPVTAAVPGGTAAGSGGTAAAPVGGAGVAVPVGGVAGTVPSVGISQALSSCQNMDAAATAGSVAIAGAVAISDAAGQSCSYSPQRFDLGPTASPQQVAVAQGKLAEAVYDTHTTAGEHVRVLTTHLGAAGSGYAISSIASLTNMDASLHGLAIGLGFAALGAILLAAAAGFLVARGALRPVRRLTRAAEHVAATDDLSVRLPVESADELGRLGRAFNRMTRSLAASRERQQRLISDAGHELRTPLTSLRTNVDLLVRSRRTGQALAPDDEAEVIDGLDQQVYELTGLVTDLLELSRHTEGARRTIPVALHEAVDRAVRRARLRGPLLDFDAQIEPWYVQGDPTGLERAVVNLLDNAVKFSPPGAAISVRLSGGEYSVRDHGPGIDPTDLPRVFERFYRSTSARALPGSGLGLAIVAQVADETGGGVVLEAAPGGGTLARLTLPGTRAETCGRLDARG
jgi:two-component system sensor histidine kinase MprB